MKQQKTSLFVVIDPTAPHQLAMVKALLIAKLGDCRIHAFMCVYEDIDEGGAAASRKDFKRKVLARAADRLEEIMQPCRLGKVPYTTEVVWNSQWVDSLLRSVKNSGCDLLIKSSYHHGRARRFFSETSDYQLMHHCRCPILFTHRQQDWHSDRMLACLDLESTDVHHARLNDEIVRDAAAFATVMGMDLYLAGVFQDAIDLDHLALEGHRGAPHDEQVGAAYGVAADRVLLRRGRVVPTLRAICDEIEPSVVVIGTLARRGIQGKLIGNTAEKLLDEIDADLLTISAPAAT